MAEARPSAPADSSKLHLPHPTRRRARILSWSLSFTMFSTHLRIAGQDDLELLWEFLSIAAYESDAAAARAVPVVAAHLAGWQRRTDFGFIAERNGQALGAAWARQFVPAEAPSFYVNEHTPEVSMGVLASERGRGVGGLLIRALITEARHRRVDLCLNVRDSNSAVQLYERSGFRRVAGSRIPNRSGGFSFGMMLDTSRLS